MPSFAVGQRVRVAANNPDATTSLCGREGVITFFPPRSEVDPDGTDQLLEPQYMVRFDGDTGDRPIYESWLEPV